MQNRQKCFHGIFQNVLNLLTITSSLSRYSRKKSDSLSQGSSDSSSGSSESDSETRKKEDLKSETGKSTAAKALRKNNDKINGGSKQLIGKAKEQSKQIPVTQSLLKKKVLPLSQLSFASNRSEVSQSSSSSSTSSSSESETENENETKKVTSKYPVSKTVVISPKQNEKVDTKNISKINKRKQSSSSSSSSSSSDSSSDDNSSSDGEKEDVKKDKQVVKAPKNVDFNVSKLPKGSTSTPTVSTEIRRIDSKNGNENKSDKKAKSLLKTDVYEHASIILTKNSDTSIAENSTGNSLQKVMHDFTNINSNRPVSGKTLRNRRRRQKKAQQAREEREKGLKSNSEISKIYNETSTTGKINGITPCVLENSKNSSGKDHPDFSENGSGLQTSKSLTMFTSNEMSELLQSTKDNANTTDEYKTIDEVS